MMGTEIFKIDASWAEKLTKTRVSFLTAPTVVESQSDVLICRQCAKVFLVDCKSGALSQVVLVLVVSARVK